MASVLGIDYGSKYVGIARGDSRAKLASALAVWPNDDSLMTKIKDYAASEQVETLVLGLPLNLEGEETAQAATTREFGAKLESATGLKVVYQAETATSVMAGKSATSGRVDDQAATLILQDYFNAR